MYNIQQFQSNAKDLQEGKTEIFISCRLADHQEDERKSWSLGLDFDCAIASYFLGYLSLDVL